MGKLIIPLCCIVLVYRLRAVSNSNMGLLSSKKVANNGDHQTQVINHLESHTEILDQTELKLWLIIIVVCAQLLLLVYKMHKKQSHRQALKAAKSVAAVNNA